MTRAKKDQQSGLLIQQVFFLTFISHFLSILVQTLGNVIDGFIVGQTMSIDDISANTVTAPLWLMVAIVGNLLTKGGQHFTSSMLSAGKSEEAKKIVSMTFTGTLIFAVTTAVLVITFSGPLTVFLGIAKSNPAYGACRAYMCGAACSIPGMALFVTFSSFMQLMGLRKQVMRGVITMTVADFVLDLIVVFVLHGGMFLIGIATAISYYLCALVFIPSFFRKDAVFRIRFLLPGRDLLREVINRGLPYAVSRMTTSMRALYINHLLAAGLSSVGLAAYHIQVQTNYLYNAFIMGLGQTLGLMSAVFYAEEDTRNLKKTMSLALGIHIIASIVLITLSRFDGPLMFLIRMFLGDKQEAYHMTGVALRLYFLGTLGMGLAILFANYLQAIKKTAASSVIYILDDMVLLFAGVVLAGHFTMSPAGSEEAKMTGVFVGIMLAQFLIMPAIPLIMAIINKKVSFGWRSILMIPEGFGTSENEELSGNVMSMEDVVSFSEKAFGFCRELGLPARTAYLVSLACEEIGKNVVEHGFHKGRRNYFEIRIVKRTDGIVIRFRDNCVPFNPVKFYEDVYDKSKQGDYFGILMIMRLSKEVSYTSIFRLNNFMIKI